jgi:hypothetical protein
MYKFSICHIVGFHGFFVPFTDFWKKKNRPVSDKIHPEIATLIFEKITNLSVKSTD